MSTRHAAALALLGWYLMLPQVYRPTKDKPASNNRGAPVSKWDIHKSFDSAAECEKERDNLQRSAETMLEPSSRGDPDGKYRALGEADEVAVCIASDDPRLVR
jgi:hypothetical protein